MLPLLCYNVGKIDLRKQMRIFLMAMFALSPLFGIAENTNTMKADFVQTIINDKNVTIVYKGDMLAKRPSFAMWHYSEPVEKSVYITANKVTIVEPELEQAIIKRLDNSIDILAILSNATKITDEKYMAFYHDKEYTITLDKQKVDTIIYKDAFGNRVSIVFDQQEINIKLDDALFNAIIPLDYDIIKD